MGAGAAAAASPIHEICLSDLPLNLDLGLNLDLDLPAFAPEKALCFCPFLRRLTVP